MAHELARRAEDREVPGSSPTQDKLFIHVHVTSWINMEVKPQSESTFNQKLWSTVEYLRGTT